MPEIETSDLRQTIGDLVVASHRLARLAAHVTGNTESPATWRTLSVLQSVGPMRLGELAAHSRVSQPTMTKIVHRMKAEGYVDTRASATDGRVTEVLLMPKGRQSVKQVRAQAGRIFQQAFYNLSDSQLTGLNDVLQQIFQNLENADG